SNHAGTTPMDMRKDALFTANNTITKIHQNLDSLHDDELVYTIGRMNVSPNIHTVIPHKVVFSLEARHKSPDLIKQVENVIQEVTQLSTSNQCHIEVTKLWDRDTVWFNEEVCHLLEQSTKSLGYAYKKM